MSIPDKYLYPISVFLTENNAIENENLSKEEIHKKVCSICRCSMEDLYEALWIDDNEFRIMLEKLNGGKPLPFL